MNTDPNSLGNLHDVVEPTAVSAWPFAPGVWLLLALALTWFMAFASLWWLRRRRNAYRRAALKELSAIEAQLRSGETRGAAVRDLCEFLKRVALAAYPREQVAPLSGNAWLAFLDKTMKGTEFSSGVGQVLPRISCESSHIPEADVKHLVKLTAQWVRTHRVVREA